MRPFEQPLVAASPRDCPFVKVCGQTTQKGEGGEGWRRNQANTTTIHLRLVAEVKTMRVPCPKSNRSYSQQTHNQAGFARPCYVTHQFERASAVPGSRQRLGAGKAPRRRRPTRRDRVETDPGPGERPPCPTAQSSAPRHRGLGDLTDKKRVCACV